MAKFTVRPYYGYDCDSEMGFNNGRHLPPIDVDAASPEDAIEKAMNEFLGDDVNELVPASAEIDGWFGENTVYWEFDSVWRRGNEETTTEPEEDDGEEWSRSYLYQYIDFSNVEEATDAI